MGAGWTVPRSCLGNRACNPLLERLLEKYPFDPKALADLGKLLAIRGESAKSIEAYRRSLAADSSQYRLHYRLFQLYKQTGDTAQAQRELKIFEAAEAERRKPDVTLGR
jgi:DNA-binding SARP family transcriptional activator